ncbi:probable G-protein coupled receptor B0563.6 [Athalia rosae]|uniref:probable G-protein coupled receptor B0563.6 n=1 Tax=Athalia rosae TaxID=37344 RepID=UPI0020332CAC|nr:probable G-protein coupled receptor B0563.6 [Athalia rosae]XP_048508264.1 probable G-protein coupled receptor B0563.6 [Athalia rosae]XP_048508265.1 probable G-protein coupled receptor B0563.6 [Athalia rosae]
MLTGVIYGLPLCCEANNTSWNFNNLDEFDKNEEEIRKRLFYVQWMAYGVVAPIFLAAGIFGNVLTLVALSSSSLRGVTYVYLTGLAVADIGVVVFWVPIAARLGYGISGYYLAAVYHAHVELVAVNTFMAASVFIMACLTVDRYLSVFLPGRLRGGYIRRNSNAAIAVSFLVGFLVSVPLGAMRSVYEQQDGPDVIFTLRENTLVTQTELWGAYLWANEVLVCFGPAAILVILNGLIVRKFIQLTAKRRKFHAVSDKYRASHIAETSSLTRNRGYREEQHLVILVTAIVLLFFVTTTPSACLLAWHADRPETDVGFQKFRAIANVAEMSNFALNFYVYLGCSTEFRGAVSRILHGHCGDDCREPNHDTPVGEIEDFSRHGTTFRMSPEHTKLNSPGSPSRTVQNIVSGVQEESPAVKE